MQLKRVLFVLALPVLFITLLLNGVSQATPSSPTNTPAELELSNQLGGAVTSVVIDGNLAYVSMGPRIRVLDVTNPATPVLIGQSPVFTEAIDNLALSSGHLFGTQSNYVVSIDISTSTIPTVANKYFVPGEIVNLIITDTIAYTFIGSTSTYTEPSSIRALDISNPVSISQLAELNETRSIASAAINGSYLYINSFPEQGGTTTLNIYDISQSTAISLVTEFPTQFSQITVIYENYLISSDSFFRVYDLTNPVSPTLLYLDSDTLFSPKDMFISGDKAWVSSGGIVLVINDLANIATDITRIDTYVADEFGFTGDIVFTNNAIYAAGTGGGLYTFEPTPSTFSLESTYDSFGEIADVDVNNNLLYVLEDYEGVQIYDLSNPITPTFVGSSAPIVGDLSDRLEQLVATDEYVYVAHQGGYLTILNITNPAVPLTATERYQYSNVPETRDFLVSEPYVYIASETTNSSVQNSLHIIDVSDPFSPTNILEMGTLGLDGYGLEKNGNLLYLAEWNGSSGGSFAQSQLSIFDITNPISPSVLVTYTSTNSYRALTADENYLYVATDDRQLEIFDISTPAVIQPVTTYDLSDYGITPNDITKAGDFIFVTKLISGEPNPNLIVIDVSNPEMPEVVKQYDADGTRSRVALDNNFAYLAAEFGGLHILSYPVPTISISETSINIENAGFVFTTTLSETSDNTVTVDYTITASDTLRAPTAAITSTITFPPGETAQVTTATLTTEMLANGFSTTLTNPTNATLSDATINISVAELPPLASLNQVVITENTTVFTSTLSKSNSTTVTVDYTITPSEMVRTPTAAITGTITFPPGETVQVITETLTAEMLANGFSIALTSANNAVLSDSVAVSLPPSSTNYLTYLPLIQKP